jgi:hypothetical protein
MKNSYWPLSVLFLVAGVSFVANDKPMWITLVASSCFLIAHIFISEGQK